MGYQLTQVKRAKLQWMLVFLFVVIFYIGNRPVQAQEYIIGVEDVSYYPFYDFSAHNVEQESFIKELLSNFFRAKGYQFKFVALPVKRFDKWYVEEAIDFKFPDNVRWRNAESKKLNVNYSQPVLQLSAGSYVLKKNKDMSREMVKRLGTIFGFYPTLWYDRIENETVELIEASSSISLVKHLLRGNVDAINIDINVIKYNLQLLGNDDDAVMLNENIHHENYAYHFSSIHYPKIIQEFDEFIVNHRQLLTELKTKYGIVESQ